MRNIEHLKYCLPNDKKTMMKKDTLYWITDRTPHESVPMKKAGYRQFFRLVTSNLSVWYPEHSTANPVGIIPDEDITIIDNRNKFQNRE